MTARTLAAAQVELARKEARSPFQTLRLPAIELYRDTLAYSPRINPKPRGVYAEEYGVVFEDFDFDGKRSATAGMADTAVRRTPSSSSTGGRAGSF